MTTVEFEDVIIHLNGGVYHLDEERVHELALLLEVLQEEHLYEENPFVQFLLEFDHYPV
jgi:hypothetical protein